MEALELDVRLTEQDYILANFWFLFRTWSARALIPFAVILLGMSIFPWIENPVETPWFGFILPAIVVLMLVSVYFGSKRSMASNKSLQRDREAKLELYSRRGVPEYWILDWRMRQVQVYRRLNVRLELAATLLNIDSLSSPLLLPGFACKVSELFEDIPVRDAE